MRFAERLRAAIAAALVGFLCTGGTSTAATIDADLMFVVDGSGSMGDDFTHLGAGMTTFVNGLRADPRIGSIRVGLVRYSLNQLLQINLTDDLTVFTGLSRGKGNFATENPLQAIDFAVTHDEIVYRPDAVRTIILITDEEGDDFLTYSNSYGTGVSALNMLLDQHGFLNNIIHNPRKRGSTANYSQIARPHGALFDIADFRADPNGFLSYFAGVKVQEFVDVRTQIAQAPIVTPLPAGAWLLLAGLGALAVVRRRAG
jgi:antitoxin component HigA of HigAB toxin-antitoxin module